MAKPPYLLLVHNSFCDSTARVQERGGGYSAAFLKQLEKMQSAPHRAGDRYDCDGLPSCYADFIYKCDIGGPRGPKVFYYIWNSQKLVIPFFVTPTARRDIDYASLEVEKHAAEIIDIVNGWPDTASDCEMWMISDGQLVRTNAGEYIARLLASRSVKSARTGQS